ncbi:MAG: AlpA family phage regulatory protein [Mariprofundales bacterium]
MDSPLSIHAILRVKEVMKLVGLGRTTIWRLEKKGAFPKRVKLSPNTIGWYSNEIKYWLETRKRL